eukprot:3141631-Heterocapsa_arctica.AAC.1
MHPVEKEGKHIKRYTRKDIGTPDQHNKYERTKTTDKPSHGDGVIGEGDYEVQKGHEEINSTYNNIIFE